MWCYGGTAPISLKNPEHVRTFKSTNTSLTLVMQATVLSLGDFRYPGIYAVATEENLMTCYKPLKEHIEQCSY